MALAFAVYRKDVQRSKANGTVSPSRYQARYCAHGTGEGDAPLGSLSLSAKLGTASYAVLATRNFPSAPPSFPPPGNRKTCLATQALDWLFVNEVKMSPISFEKCPWRWG